MNGNENEKTGKRIIRDDDNVVLQILSIANGGASENDIKSQIKALASDTKLLESYLEHLMDSGLIGYNDDRSEPRVYMTTDEGLRFLKSFERVETGADRHEPPKGLLHLDWTSFGTCCCHASIKKKKLLAPLLQLPPSLTAKEGLKKLEALIHMLDSDFRYAIEVRNKSRFDRSVYKLLSDNNICLAWSQLDTIQTPPELTSDFIYLRLIGDRSINEKDFGRIQKDRLKELRVWSDTVQRVKDKTKFAIVAANNHYAGFGPAATANSFRKMVGLEEAVWEEIWSREDCDCIRFAYWTDIILGSTEAVNYTFAYPKFERSNIGMHNKITIYQCTKILKNVK